MDKIEIEVPVSFVESGIEQMERDIDVLEDALGLLEMNGLDDNEGYWKLDAKRADLQAGVEQMRDELDHHNEGVENLFD